MESSLDSHADKHYITFMHDDMTTVLTVRGQTSVPARFRKEAHLQPGQRLRWYRAAPNEFRVVVETPETAAGPLAALGYAEKFHPQDVPTTERAMRVLREGEHS